MTSEVTDQIRSDRVLFAFGNLQNYITAVGRSTVDLQSAVLDVVVVAIFRSSEAT
jgi:hypothetical protein